MHRLFAVKDLRHTLGGTYPSRRSMRRKQSS